MAIWAWILIAIAVVVVVALAALAERRRRTAALRERFGPEYDRTVEASDDRRAAEAELRERERQRANLDIKPLPESTRAGFAQEWKDVQERFVDQPSEAVVAADGLVYRVMEARGYPMGDFDAQASLVSVDYPEVVDNYRFAHDIHERAQAQQVSTEDLREALLRYRSLFDELLRAPDGKAERADAAIREDEALREEALRKGEALREDEALRKEEANRVDEVTVDDEPPLDDEEAIEAQQRIDARTPGDRTWPADENEVPE
jgi:hypothetical protein